RARGTLDLVGRRAAARSHPPRSRPDEPAAGVRQHRGAAHRRARASRREVKKRLDVLLVERGLADSRAQAQALVLAGRVRGFDKPGTQVDDATEVEVERPPPYVSRGGEKLAHALDAFGVEPAGRDCLD